jgi:hypothetical protein
MATRSRSPRASEPLGPWWSYSEEPDEDDFEDDDDDVADDMAAFEEAHRLRREREFALEEEAEDGDHEDAPSAPSLDLFVLPARLIPPWPPCPSPSEIVYVRGTHAGSVVLPDGDADPKSPSVPRRDSEYPGRRKEEEGDDREEGKR